MESRHLEYFIAVAEELSFTRAAARTFAVQSTVSAAIRSLEHDFGATLFERSTKRVALTPAGEQLLPRARVAVEAIDAARSSVALTEAGIRGRLRVGIFASLDLLDLPSIFGDFHEKHPLVDLQLTASQSGSTGFADDVRRGRVDVAFMGLPALDLPDIHSLTLTTTEFVAVLPHAHPLAAVPSVALAQIAGEAFVDTPPGFGNRVVFERALAAEGLTRSVSTVVSDLGEVPRFVAAGLGIAVVPLALLAHAEGAAIVPLAQRIEWTLSLISRPNPSPATSALLALMRERLGRSSSARPVSGGT
ncbi:LysR family transcriptional regulator [soil metagenome]